MKKFRCPRCGETVREDELQVVDEDGFGDGVLLSGAPPKHLAVETSIEGISTVTTIRYARVNPVALFLVPFTCIWAGGSLSGIYGSQILKGEFDLKLSLFGLPFLFGSLLLLTICLFLLFGKHVLRLSAGKGSYFVGIGPIGRTRHFRYGHASKVAEDSFVRQGRRGGPYVTKFLRLSNEGEADSTSLCSGFSDDALAYTAALLRRECRRA